MIKKISLLLICGLVAILLGYFYLVNQVNRYIEQPVQIQQPEMITIKKGSSFLTVLGQIEKLGWADPSFYSKFVRHMRPELTKVKAGTFHVPADLSLAQLLTLLGEGKEHQFAITFIEGSRFSEWREILSQSPNLVHNTAELTEAEIAKNIAITETLGVDISKLEGLLLAETYYYTSGTTELDILKRAHKDLVDTLNTQWENKQQNLPLGSAYQALILASIIEKETSLDEERTKVASVFINRLNRGMRLQTDPTVIYGMGEAYDGNIRKKDLQTPTPYNTYVIKGLPPTPIAMVGKASIAAALNPDKSDYLYFVASGTGGHVFSKTLKQHNRAVANYLKQLRSRK